MVLQSVTVIDGVTSTIDLYLIYSIRHSSERGCSVCAYCSLIDSKTLNRVQFLYLFSVLSICSNLSVLVSLLLKLQGMHGEILDYFRLKIWLKANTVTFDLFETN